MAPTRSRGITPRVVLTALDLDLIKSDVRMGLGIGILARMAYDPATDVGLGMTDAAHLFDSSRTRVGVRRNAWLRGYADDFIELFAPHRGRRVSVPAGAGGGGKFAIRWSDRPRDSSTA